jgi:hypothetical protein
MSACFWNDAGVAFAGVVFASSCACEVIESVCVFRQRSTVCGRGGYMESSNPYFQLLVGFFIVVFYFPVMVFGAYRIMQWLLNRFDTR